MLANGLSLLRAGLAPAVVYSLYVDGADSGLRTFGLLALAGASDLLDGIAARRLHQVSRLGRVLDPLADKLFIGAVGAALVVWRDFPVWLLVLQVARDAAIVAAGCFLLRSRRQVAAPSRTGKAATWSMALAILAHVLNLAAPVPGIAHTVTALLIVVSGAGYARRLRRLLRSPAAGPAAARSTEG